MAEFKSILCPIDFSDTSAEALRHGAALSKWYGARLTVVHVQPAAATTLVPAVQLGEAGPVQTVPSRDEVIALMQRVVTEAGAGSMAPRLVMEFGVPHETIARLVASLPADLLVLGTHGRSGFNRLLLGSITEKVVRTATCPVLTVPPRVPSVTPVPVAFKRILCPIDFSPSSLKALSHAIALGSQAGGSVTVITAIEYLDTPPDYSAADREYQKQLVAHARERLHAQLSAEQRTRCEIQEDVVTGRAYREVLNRAAAMSADLIVMGAQGHGGVELMLYGSNTQHVVRRATCPVLTVRA